MKMPTFKNIFQKNQGSITQSGFTLVEISIVMIIIGLLIGGIFSGMKLIDNANVQRTVQDLKSVDAALLTFRDTYRALPGDIRNPNTRIPNCAAVPCSTSGNGDRMIGGIADGAAITTSDEEFVFWQHLRAAELISFVKPVSDLTPGEGQPESPIDSGTYRVLGHRNGIQHFQTIVGKHLLFVSTRFSEQINVAGTQNQNSIPCAQGRNVDIKIDDGRPLTGRVVMWGDCVTSASLVADYALGAVGSSLEYTLPY